MACQSPGRRWHPGAVPVFRKCISGLPQRFVANNGVGGAIPEMRSRNRVGGPLVRDLLFISIVARGGKAPEWERGGTGGLGFVFVEKKYFESRLMGFPESSYEWRV